MRGTSKFSIPFAIFSIFALLGIILSSCFNFLLIAAQTDQKVILSSIFFDTERTNDWNRLIEKGMNDLRQRHPDLDIQMDYRAIYLTIRHIQR
jgi:hypothetical protein